jgi:hypothetical protein
VFSVSAHQWVATTGEIRLKEHPQTYLSSASVAYMEHVMGPRA